jgi:hypothetical protein
MLYSFCCDLLEAIAVVRLQVVHRQLLHQQKARKCG